MLSVNTNNASQAAQSAYANKQQAVNQVLAELGSGSSINSAADNPAGLAVSEGLTTQINGDQQAVNNANTGISLAQTASTALSQLQSNTEQLQQLAVQANNGTLNDTDRAAIQDQVDQLTQANSQIVQNTQFDGTPLLSGNTSITLQVGADGTPVDQITLNGTGLDNPPASGGLNGYNDNLTATKTIDVSSQAAAQNAMTLLGQDMQTLSGAQSELGGVTASLADTVNNLQTSSINEQAAQSGISSTDYAAASADLAQQQIQGNASTATMAQANMSQAAALALLQGI
jgi:flagellin